MRWLQYIFFVVLLTLKATSISAQEEISREISLIYHNLGDKGQFTENDFNFLQSIKEDDLLQSPDSVVYQYHYLIGLWLDFNEGDLQKRMYHVSKALHLTENSKKVTSDEFGIFDIEYLWLSKAMAEYYEESGNIDKAIMQYERTLVRGEQILLDKESNKNLRGVKSGCLSTLGELYAKKGYKREAISCFEKAFEISKVDYEQGATETYFPLWLLSNYYVEEKDYEKSILSWKRLIQFFEENKTDLSKECASSYYFLGNVYGKTKKWESAINSYKKALSIYKNINADLSLMESTYSNLWCVYAEIGDMAGFQNINSVLKEYYFSQNKIEDYYRSLWAATTLLPIDKTKSTKDELLKGFSKLDVPMQVRLLIRMADESLKDQPNNAIIYSQKAIDIIDKSEYKDSAAGWYYHLHQIRSIAYQNQNEKRKAIDEVQRSLEYFAKCKDATDTTRQQILFRLSNLYLDCKDYEKAAEVIDILIPLTIQLYGEGSREYTTNMNEAGICLMYSGKYKKAIKLFKELSSMIQKDEGENSINYATNIHNLGRAYMLKGDKQNAIACFERAKALQLAIEGTINSKTNQYLNELGIYE